MPPRAARQLARNPRSGCRGRGDPVVRPACISLPAGFLSFRTGGPSPCAWRCGSIREPGPVSPARAPSLVRLMQEVSWVVCRILNQFSFQGKKKNKQKNLPEKQAGRSRRINNGFVISATDRAGSGRSPLEAHTPLQYGPAKVTGWEGRDGREQTPGCQGRGSPFWAQGKALL